MTDRRVVALACAAMLGAWWSHPIPVIVLGGLVTATLAWRRPSLVLLSAGLLASFLGARSWEGVHSAPTTGNVEERVRIVRDPEWAHGAVQTEFRLGDGRRLQASAEGSAGAVLQRSLAGETVRVSGRLGPLRGRNPGFLHRRHIGSRLDVRTAERLEPGGPVARFSNELRRSLVAGATSLADDDRALFTGIVLGDDRDQSPAAIDDFRASGLTHLLAVSGQNVAFVLVIAAPLMRRLAMRHRLVVGASVLFVFGVITRWEPSVLRAVAMAGLALVATTLGRPVSPLRVLSLAVTALVLIDPLLAGSIGFLLSAGACAGIAVLGPQLEGRGVPAPLAVTLAAQIGVAPVLVPVFGGMPLASIPANLVAVPAAGPLMVWGLAAGLPAGLVGGPVAAVVHVPSRFLLWWISGVAHIGAGIPLPEVGAVAAVGSASVIGALVLLRRRRLVVAGWAVATSTAVLLVAAAVFLPPGDVAGRSPIEGMQLWRKDGAVVVSVSGSVDEGRLLQALRRERVRRIDVLVIRSPKGTSARLAAAVRHRAQVRSIVAPPGHLVAGATTASTGQRLGAGPLEVVVDAEGPPMKVRVGSPDHAPGARSPPLRRDHTRAGHGHPEPNDRLVLRPGRVLRPR